MRGFFFGFLHCEDYLLLLLLLLKMMMMMFSFWLV